MSKADEMFEALGYEKVWGGRNTEYEKTLSEHIKVNIFFSVDRQLRKVCVDVDGVNPIYVTMSELDAINEKVKELGWVE